MNQLSVILPVHNERDTIGAVLREWATVLDQTVASYSLTVCEDGSVDGTKELLDELKARSCYPLVLNQRESRRGYGGAVLDGVADSDSTWILCIDSDGQCDPSDFPSFWERRNSSDVIIGWRTSRADSQQRKVISAAFRAAFRLLFRTPVHDPSAPYVLFKKDAVTDSVRYLRFMKEGFWWGFIGMCTKRGLTVREVAVNHRPRLAGDTQVYKLDKLPSIAVRNLLGLVQLRLAR